MYFLYMFICFTVSMSRYEKSLGTDSVQSHFSSKTSRGKKGQHKIRHQQRHHERQPGEQPFTIQVATG